MTGKMLKKSSKTRRAPKAPKENNEDLDAIQPYEDPLPVPENKDTNNNNSSIRKSPIEEIKEIKPKSFSGKCFKLNSGKQRFY